MSEMVERVAKALEEADIDNLTNEQIASVAMAAMREPTEAMRQACFEGWKAAPQPTADSLWKVMIDAALK